MLNERAQSETSLFARHDITDTSLLVPKTEIAIEWQAEKDHVGRAERGYNGCATKHNHEPTR